MSQKLKKDKYSYRNTFKCCFIQGESERSTTDLWKIININPDVLWLKYLYGSNAYCVFGVLWKYEIVWKSQILRYGRLNTTTLKTFLSTKPIFFEIRYFSQFDPPAMTMVSLSYKWNNGRKCNIIGKGNTWAFRAFPVRWHMILYKHSNLPKIDNLTQYRNF